GSRMVTAAEDWARELGYKKAVLESRENKTDFYEKLGYIPNENEIVRGETFTCVHMEKIL
ncbi:MAG: GNAT family N-acetyltransferase, partial [Firmicutes bacterium]|nr:GNAT family N-acetyltransferase [Bacillota bacterium]